MYNLKYRLRKMTPNIPIEFTSERLRLRRYSPENAEAYFCMLGENQKHLHEFMPENLASARDVEEVRAVILWMIEEGERGEIFNRNYKRDGTTVDRLWFGLLLREWQNSKK
jgi:RimJ/RimL family protein N-acetyltransferase